MQSLRHHAPEAVRKAPVPETPGQACVLALALMDTELFRIQGLLRAIKGAPEEIAQKYVALQARLEAIEEAKHAIEMVRLKSIGDPIPQPVAVALALNHKAMLESV